VGCAEKFGTSTGEVGDLLIPNLRRAASEAPVLRKQFLRNGDVGHSTEFYLCS
jgi:hypothetical protein